jgi:5-methylcytosine-specific restriction endonuclease McrA
MGHALVLNASFEPLHIVTWQRAIQLLFQGKVEVIEESDETIRTVRLTMKVPAVLRLLSYVPIKTKKNIIRFSRANVFTRDANQCLYCGRYFSRSHLTLDHVKPIVQGGKKSWDNIATACKPCNQRKGGRTPQEASMRLIRKPHTPAWLPTTTITVGSESTPQSWKFYLKIDLYDHELDPDSSLT